MGTITTTAIVFAFICAGILIGAVLPGQRFDDDTKEVVRLGTGLIGTLASLVLGLLVGSAKTSYDFKSGQVRQLTAEIVLLDEILAQYGPEARAAREGLRQTIPPMVQRIWHENGSVVLPATFHPTAAGLSAFAAIQQLQPKNDLEREMKTRAVQLGADTSQIRLLLYEQAGNPIPMPFLAVLTLWLVILFAGFGYFAKPNATIIVVLIIFGLSATAAIFLILELSNPFNGLMAIPSEPLKQALGAF